MLFSVEMEKDFIKNMIFKNYQKRFRSPVNRHPKTLLL